MQGSVSLGRCDLLMQFFHIGTRRVNGRIWQNQTAEGNQASGIRAELRRVRWVGSIMAEGLDL